MKIAAVQTNLLWENRDGNLRLLEKKISALQADLVVLPEMFATGFSMNTSLAEDARNGPSVLWLERMAKHLQSAICGSLMISENGNFYNRLYFVFPDGQRIIYDKRHLFSLAKENHFYTHGINPVVLEYKGWKIAPFVCYDLRFPVWSRRTEKNDYDLMIYVANWPERRSRAWQSLLQARSIENQSYCVGVNRVGLDGNNMLHSGDSRIFDPMGKEIARGIPFRDEIVSADISKEYLNRVRSQLPFFEDGDDFTIQPD